MRCDIPATKVHDLATASEFGCIIQMIRSMPAVTSAVTVFSREITRHGGPLASIRARNNVRREETFEAADISALGCCEERVEKTSLLGRTRGQPSAIGHVLPSATYHLPRVGLFETNKVRDVTVGWSNAVRRMYAARSVGESLSSNTRTPNFSTSPPCAPNFGSALVSTGSGSQDLTYVSWRERADCRRQTHGTDAC